MDVSGLGSWRNPSQVHLDQPNREAAGCAPGSRVGSDLAGPGVGAGRVGWGREPGRVGRGRESDGWGRGRESGRVGSGREPGRARPGVGWVSPGRARRGGGGRVRRGLRRLRPLGWRRGRPRWPRGRWRRRPARALGPTPARRTGPPRALSPPRARLQRPRGRRRRTPDGPARRPRRAPPSPMPARVRPALHACARRVPARRAFGAPSARSACPRRPAHRPLAYRPRPAGRPRLFSGCAARLPGGARPAIVRIPAALSPRAAACCGLVAGPSACRSLVAAASGRRGLVAGASADARRGPVAGAPRAEPAVAHRAGQPTGAHLLGDCGVGQRRLEDPRQVADHRLAGAVARLRRQPAALARHRRDEPVALGRQCAQRTAVERALGGGEVVREREQTGQLFGPLTGQQVGQPRRAGGPAEPGDGPCQVAVAHLPGFGDGVVPRGYERVGMQPIQPIGDGVKSSRPGR